MEPNVGLGWNAALVRADAGALRDQDLRLDNIDAGHAFGDRVFDLDAGVDLDEIERARVDVLQELHRARIAVACNPGKRDRG